MKRNRILFLLSVAAILAWGGYRAWRAHLNLVTLHVRNMDVRKVVSKMEWQTWERILVNKGVGGVVTLDVDSVPLEEVLNIVGLQTSSRWTSFYPIYLTSQAMVSFKKVVRGEIPPEGAGWSGLQKAPLWQRGGPFGFGNTLRSQNKLVSAQIENKDLAFATLALSRYSQARIVPQDGISGTINLKLDQAPFEKAVSQVAKQVHRKWDQIYALEPMNGIVVAKKEVKTADPEGQTNTVVVRKPKVEDPMAKEKELEAFLATMTPQEKQKAQEQIAAAQQMSSMPAAQQQAQMQAMSAQAAQASQADLESRINNRLKNGTTDQRLAHDRQQLGNRQQPKSGER